MSRPMKRRMGRLEIRRVRHAGPSDADSINQHESSRYTQVEDRLTWFEIKQLNR